MPAEGSATDDTRVKPLLRLFFVDPVDAGGTMEIQINGEPRTVEPITLMELIRSLDLDPTRLAVERNRDIVPKREYESVRLEDGDKLEIVQFVGGG
jgi:thiamine biosynthesis protein ThiS